MAGRSGRGGRPPKPTALHILDGNPSKRPPPQDEPPLEAGMPAPPPGLDVEARAEWKRIGVTLGAVGVVTKADRAMLTAWCITWSRWWAAESDIRKRGVFIADKKNETGAVENPYLKIADKACDRLLRLAEQYGMTASARVRLAIRPKTKKEAKSKWRGMLK